MVLRVATKGWNAVADALIDKGVRSGEMIVRGEADVRLPSHARQERLQLVTRAIFLLEITKIGDRACMYATNLVVFDKRTGVLRLGCACIRAVLQLRDLHIHDLLEASEDIMVGYNRSAILLRKF